MGDALTGIGVGVSYGLVAAAISVASRATRTLHLAIGPATVLGALVHLVLQAEGSLPTAATLAMGVAVGAVASGLVEPLVLQRVEDGTARLVGTFALGAVLAAVGARSLGARTVRPDALLDLGDRMVGSTVVPGEALGALVVGVPAALALEVVLRRTRWGVRVRLVGGSPAAAARVGIRPGRVRGQSLLLAGAVGTVAVLLVAPLTLLGLPQAAGLTLRAVAAAFVARDRPMVAVAVGVVMGVAEALLQAGVPEVGADVAVAAVALLALLARGGDHARSWGRTW